MIKLNVPYRATMVIFGIVVLVFMCGMGWLSLLVHMPVVVAMLFPVVGIFAAVLVFRAAAQPPTDPR